MKQTVIADDEKLYQIKAKEMNKDKVIKILTVCDQGNNRAVQFAHLLKYKYKADAIPVGLDTTSKETLDMLYTWADYIILTDKTQKVPGEYTSKVKLWDVGEDRYPRPFNPVLLVIAKKMIEDNPL